MDRLDRRQVLKQAGLAAFGTGALATLGSVPASADDRNGIVGTWHAIFKETPPAVSHLELLLAFTPGGDVVEADASAPSPSLGTWISSEEGVIFSIQSWSFNPDGSLSGKARTNCKASVHQSSISGRFHFLFYDTTGKVVFEGRGTFSGNRFEATYP